VSCSCRFMLLLFSVDALNTKANFSLYPQGPTSECAKCSPSINTQYHHSQGLPPCIVQLCKITIQNQDLLAECQLRSAHCWQLWGVIAPAARDPSFLRG
jgi:hypothetical protein